MLKQIICPIKLKSWMIDYPFYQHFGTSPASGSLWMSEHRSEINPLMMQVKYNIHVV